MSRQEQPQQQATFWSKTKTGSKLGFDKLYTLVDKLGPPTNKPNNKLAADTFWPTTLDKESDKAARILRSFCKDGFHHEEARPASADGPATKQRVLKKIPSEVIKNARGLAIFTTMRNGLWISGAGGSGVIVARLPDGTWSPPSGIMLHTAGLGFPAGVDIYDCVLVVNTAKALEAFSRLRCTLGGEVSVVAGPLCAAGGVYETEAHARQAPVFTYMKSRGLYAGVQIDGTVMLERNDENERHYHSKWSAQEILTGRARHMPVTRQLLETVKAAQGDLVADHSLLPRDPAPSDYEIEDDGQMFGVPSKDDPDPYGVLQLEKEGMLIREAGTHQRANWEQFTFKPSPTSPVFETFEGRKSRDHDSLNSRISARNSIAPPSAGAHDAADDGRQSRTSSRTTVTMVDSSMQTDEVPPTSPLPQPNSPAYQPTSPPAPNSPGRNSIRNSVISQRLSMDGIPEERSSPKVPDGRSSFVVPRIRAVPPRSSMQQQSAAVTDEVQIEPSSHVENNSAHNGETEHESGTESHNNDSGSEHSSDDELEDDSDDYVEVVQPVVVQSVQKASAPQVISKPRLVTVPKRIPPTLPTRNPNRSRAADTASAQFLEPVMTPNGTVIEDPINNLSDEDFAVDDHPASDNTNEADSENASEYASVQSLKDDAGSAGSHD